MSFRSVTLRLQQGCILLAALGSVPATAQNASVPASAQNAAESTSASPDTFPVLLSASGGISRGAYQAGVNWALVQVFRGSRDASFRARYHLPGVYRVETATGASAGNVNSVFSAIEDCASGPAAPPDSSLFWKLWANMGRDQLFEPDIRNTATNRSLLTRRYVEDSVFAAVTRTMNRPGARAGCNVPIGITLTKVRPDSIAIRAGKATRGVTAATQRFATVFAVREKEGRLVFGYAEPAIWKNGELGKIILGPSAGGRDELDARWVKDAMQASGAYPVAFQPVGLEYREAEQLDTLRRCLDSQPDCRKHAVFIDGGLFDNNPLTLALSMYEKKKTLVPGWMQSTRVLYIDTDKLRGDAARAGASALAATREADRGMSTVMQVAGSSFAAARQYELQALARMLANDSRAKWIRVTTRSQPMVGGFLNGFAAFLGKPLREYDFYTGIYDGLQYAATEMTQCGKAEAEEEGCQARVLRTLITGGDIQLGPIAPHALHASYAAEYRDTIPASLLPSLPSGASARDRSRVVLLQAMLGASRVLVERTRNRPWNNELSCAPRRWEEALLCRDGFEVMLDAFRERARPELRRWAEREECQSRNWASSPDRCPAEASFAALVEAPRPVVRSAGAALIHQLWRVEDRIGWDPALRTDSREDMVEMADFIYNGFVARRPAARGLDKDPSTIQGVSAHPWKRVASALPYSASVIMDGGTEVGYRPTYNFSPVLAGVLPLSLGYRAETGRFELAPGAGVLLRTPWILVSGVEASGQWVGSWKQKGNETAGSPAAGLAIHLVADRLRLGARYMLDDEPRIQRGQRLALSVGLNDVNGMLYWLGRLSWIERASKKDPSDQPANATARR